MAGRKRKQSNNNSNKPKKSRRKAAPKKTPLTSIPPNLLIAVLKKCTVKSLCRLRNTCKRMDTFVAENHKKIGIPVTIKLISPTWALVRYERTYQVRAERVTLDFLKESGLRIRKLFVAYNFQDTMIHCVDTILENCLDFKRIPVSVFWFTYLDSCVFDDHAGSPRLQRLISDMPNVKSIRGYLFQEGMQIWWDKYRPDYLNWKMEEIAGPPCWANINRFEKVELYWRDDYLGEHYPARLFRTLIEEFFMGDFFDLEKNTESTTIISRTC